MTDACAELRDALARGPNDPLIAVAEAHLASCASCEAHARTNDQLVAALRIEPEPIDDVTRARWLAQMGPSLDAIADRHATRHAPRRRVVWLGGVLAAAAAVACVWWLGDRNHATPQPAPAPAIAKLDRELLRPYVVSGPSTDAIANTLLAGRFATLEIASGQLVRATFDSDRDQRLAVVGPTRVAVTAATATEVDLDVAGTLLVDARAATSTIQIRAGGVTIRAQHATFSVQTESGTPVVFVDRGEITLGTTRLGPGEWSGAETARSAAIVALLRDHANAVAPPRGHFGVLAVDGADTVMTQSGAILAAAPLWVRLDAGPVVIVTAGSVERRTQVDVRDGQLVHLPALALPPITREREAPKRVAVTPTPQLAPEAHEAAEAETAAGLYAQAEAALRAGDRGAAEATWLRLVDAFPVSDQASSALYDLATSARARNDRKAAQAYLARLLAASPPAALREPAVYASCRLHVDAGEPAAAATCFTAFRAQFGDSNHDAEVLAWLAGHAEETGGCAAARALTDEYLRRYPHGAFATRAAACKDAR